MVMESLGFERNGGIDAPFPEARTFAGMFLGVVLVISTLTNLASFAVSICKAPSKSELRIGFDPLLTSSNVEMYGDSTF